MKKTPEEMSVRLFGHNKKQIEAYLKGLEADYKSEIEDLRKALDKVSAERKDMDFQLKEMQKELNLRLIDISVMKEAMERLDITTKLIIREADDEVRDIMESDKKKIDSHENMIVGTRTEIRRTREKAGMLLNNLIDLLTKEVAKGEGLFQEDMQLQVKALGKVVSFISRESNDSNFEEEKKKLIKKESAETSVEPVDILQHQVKLDGAASSCEDISHENESTPKENGHVDNIPEVTESESADEAHNGMENIDNDSVGQIQAEESRKPDETSEGTDFWSGLEIDAAHECTEEINASEDEALTASSQPPCGSVPEVPSSEVKNEDNDSFWDHEPPEHKLNETNESIEPPDNTMQAEQKQDDSNKQKDTENSVKSPALEDEINHIRDKYIIGKLAGERLLDNEGREIAAKDQVITREIIRKAESEGKLSELILTMVIPGLEK